jgi:hypothetical protein
MVMKVNLVGTFVMIKHAVDIMAKQPALNEDGERGTRFGRLFVSLLGLIPEA